MFTNTKFIMLSILLATGNAAAYSTISNAIPIITSKPASAASNAVASTVTYITPTAPTGGQNGGQPGPSFGGSYPSGGQNGGSGGVPNAHLGSGGSSPSGGVPTSGQNSGPHSGTEGSSPGGEVPTSGQNSGQHSESGGSISSGMPHSGGMSPGEGSSSGFPGGSTHSNGGRPFSRNVARQNQPYHSSGSQSSDITTADNSTFTSDIIAYYEPSFTARGLSTVHNETQGQKLVEFIQVNGGEKNGDWWKVSDADFVSHIQNYTSNIGGTVYDIKASDISA